MSQRARQSGQSVVEAAIAMPAMIFFILCTIQLTLIQQARLMSSYAAFTAARAGIVFNADPDRMREAAFLALLPTMGTPTTSLTALGSSAVANEVRNQVFKAVIGAPLVDVKITSPKASDFNAWGGHLGGREIDFDDIRPGAQEALTLSVNLTYYYRMFVPFANRMIQSIWIAGQIGTLKFWTGPDLTNPRYLTTNGGTTAVGETRAQAAILNGIDLAKLILAGEAAQRGIPPPAGYYFPIKTSYSLKMQSNPYKRNVP